ncbi:MAG TPA: hypothetical protein PL001_10220, partial [Candidatus Kryptobacter bacterium]|nr:hypothetical protein [Candidatus Kryptobacter bacterium]
QLKHSEPALAAYAEFVPLYAKKDAYPFIYARALGNDVVLVILNPAEKESNAEFTMNVSVSKRTLLAGKEMEITEAEGGISVNVPGRTYAIYRLA